LLIGLLLLLTGCSSAPVIEPDVVHHNAHGGGTELALNESASLLASGGWSGRLRLWRIPDGKALLAWQAHPAEVTGIGFFDRGKRILSTGLDGSLVVWNLQGQALYRRLADSSVTTMALDETLDTVVTGHHDGSVRLWRLTDLSAVADFPLHSDSVRAVALHGAGGWFASSDSDTEVFLWRRDGSYRVLAPPATDVRTLSFTPNGDWLYGAGWFRLWRWKLPGGERQILKTEHFGIINSIWFTDDGGTLASISRQTDSSVLFLDPANGDTVKRLQRHDLCGAAVRVSGDGRFVASTSDDGSVRIWDLQALGNR
jgi:WD40 repeat protein